MAKVHLDLRATSYINEAYKYTSDEIYRITGANLGNLAFRHALKMLIEDFEEYIPMDYKGLQEMYSHLSVEQVVVSCANWLGTREADENSNRNRANAVESVSAPMCCFGLGVQAPREASKVDLGPESQRLAHSLAQKASLISVRDKLTAKTLRSIGIENTVVTGCPSNFINNDATLGQRIINQCEAAIAENRGWPELRGCISEFSGGDSHTASLVANILGVLKDTPAFYVVQSPVLMPFLLKETEEVPPLYGRNSRMDINETRAVLQKSALAFTSVDSWLDFARTCSYSFGMRIHGTVIPIQAGVPSLLIAHDSRTAGLSDVMGIPAIDPSEFSKFHSKGAKYFFSTVCEQMRGYDNRRMGLAADMKAFIEQNELVPTKELTRLSGGA